MLKTKIPLRVIIVGVTSVCLFSLLIPRHSQTTVRSRVDGDNCYFTVSLTTTSHYIYDQDTIVFIIRSETPS